MCYRFCSVVVSAVDWEYPKNVVEVVFAFGGQECKVGLCSQGTKGEKGALEGAVLRMFAEVKKKVLIVGECFWEFQF